MCTVEQISCYVFLYLSKMIVQGQQLHNSNVYMCCIALDLQDDGDAHISKCFTGVDTHVS